WDAGKWNTLERLASSAMGKPGLFARLFSSRHRNTPALALLGAALYETGQRAKGLAALQEYETRWARFWTMDYLAIARYYAAKERLAAKDEKNALALFEKSWELAQFARTADAIAKLAGHRPGRSARLLGKRLSLD